MFDTETTIDATQALLFGAWRYYRVVDGVMVCVQEGLFHGDDLPSRDPVGYEALRKYAASHRPNLDKGWERKLPLLTRREFCERILFRAGYQTRARIIGFNLPFDLSRLAIHVTEGRARNRGGFSFILYPGNEARGFKENRWRPRVQIKHVDSHRAFISFSKPLGETERWDGDFVDLRTLSFALTGRGHSLQSASKAFGLEGKSEPGEHGRITASYIDYCRQDVTATADLYREAKKELERWNLQLPANKATSPASIAKALLAELGVVPPLTRQPDLDPKVMGWAMSAFYGGRAECRIRKTPVPIRLVDFTATYPTLFSLLDMWPLATARKLKTQPATKALRQLLADVTVDAVFDTVLWPQLIGIALIQPDGDTLPVRAQYNPYQPTFGIGVNPLTSNEPMWFTFADLVASTLLTGKPPKILKALRFVPVGKLAGLHPVTLPGGHVVDPRTDDPFRAMVEHRQRARSNTDLPAAVRDRIQLGLKIVANAGSYGIWAEYNRRELPIGERATVDVYGKDNEPFTNRIHAPEDPGRYCCPPIAAVITGAARLLLALLERCVTDLGGSWAMADTDSMGIVATSRGGPVPCQGGKYKTKRGSIAVRALRYSQVEAIRSRFEALNPYDTDALPGSILKSEVDATCYAIAAKRYALYRTDEQDLPKLVARYEHEACSHGLGHLHNPSDTDNEDRDWIVQLWEHGLDRELGGPATGSPHWFSRMALGRTSVTSPAVLASMAKVNERHSYAGWVKPFNFLLHAPGAQPADTDLRRRASLTLLAPYEGDPKKWACSRWVNLTDPEVVQRVTASHDVSGNAWVPSYRDIAERYFAHPEPKSVGFDGSPCGRATRGLLRRRLVHASRVTHLGKEGNGLRDRETGLIGVLDVDQVLLTYTSGDERHTESVEGRSP